MSTLTIPQLQDLCNLARVNFETDRLIIAGGAPRDVLSGVPVKDIDIFVKVDVDDVTDAYMVKDCGSGEIYVEGSSKFVKDCRDFARAVGGEAKFRASPESYGALADLCDISKDGVDGAIQVIAIFNDPVDDVHAYDFGLSQVFVTPHGLFHTAAATLDRDARQVTYLGHRGRDEASILRSKARLARLRAKYDGWKFVGCEELDAFEPTPALALDGSELMAALLK